MCEVLTGIMGGLVSISTGVTDAALVGGILVVVSTLLNRLYTRLYA